MGLFQFLVRLFFGRPAPPPKATGPRGKTGRKKPRLTAPRLSGKDHSAPLLRKRPESQRAPRDSEKPYAFARLAVGTQRFLDLSQDGDDELLDHLGLPRFRSPEELAAWLEMPLGRLAWLVHRFQEDSRPQSEKEAHYHYRWLNKRRGGHRLIESPKRKLKAVQQKILNEILDRIPVHPNAHGFVEKRSILTNATPHAGAAVLLKYDLANFYASVSFARVTAIFRRLGYSREAAIWLGRLTTSALPANIPFLKDEPSAVLPYLRRHLPQGAPTSPALANLSAYWLDVRLSGLAAAFGARYTRYADDLTFSGPPQFSPSLRDFIPLTGQVIRQERFRVNKAKRKVVRRAGTLLVTGVVVNEKPNVRRKVYDRLKAVLTNCVRHGPSTQNRGKHPRFAAHLRGRIAHVAHLNPARGAKLLAIYDRIDWNR